MNPEILIAQEVIQLVGLAGIFYGSMIFGLEIGGRINGYPGRGKETHERCVNAVKNILHISRNKRNKK